MPKPGDLPVDRNAVARPPGPPPLFSSPPPAPPRAPERPQTKTPPLGLSLDLPLPPPPEPPPGGQSLTLGDPLADAPSDSPPPPLNLGTPPASPPIGKAPPPTPAPPTRLETKAPDKRQAPPPLPKAAAKPGGIEATLPSLFSTAKEPPAAFGPGSKPIPSHKPTLAPLVPEPSEAPPADEQPEAPQAGVAIPPRSAGAAPAAGSAGNLDLGFSLEFEGSPRTGAGESPIAIPFPSARVATEGTAEAAAADIAHVPTLSPPSARGPTSARAMRPVARRAGIPRWVFFVGGAVVLAAAGVGIGIPLLRSAPDPQNVLKPLLPELAKDNLAAYKNAVQELGKIAARYEGKGVNLRLKAAELQLIALVVHGGAPKDVAAAEQAAAAAASEPELAPAVGRVRALAAIANGKPGGADKLLRDPNAPESRLIVGLARLAENRLQAAVAPLRAFIADRPNDLLGHYLLGRALAKGPEARKQFELVLAKNAAHGGARIGLASLEETPQKRLEAAKELLESKLAGTGPADTANLQFIVGQAHQALGHSHEALDAFAKAIHADKRFMPAYLALGEALLYDGRYAEAAERLKAAGSTLETNTEGKFALAGAMIGSGKAKEGLALVTAAATEQKNDPQGPYWRGVAATLKQPPDPAAAELGFREALKKDPKFLPASLKLAALLQQQGKAEDSLTVLRAAEEAGAPPSVLQIAWGDALIVANQAEKALEVFEKALEADPTSVPARLGIAAALQAQDKLEEAKVSLERTLKEFPESLGLRERLAQVCLKLGQKSEALAHYQAEIQAGHPTVTIRLAVARLALELEKYELAQSEVKKVFDQSPRNAEASYYMARIYEHQGSNGLALTEYRHATTWGNMPEYALHYGRLLDKLGKQQEALASLANATSLAAGRRARGRIYFRTGDLEGALADFQAAWKLNPKDPEPLILEGHCHDKLGDAVKADRAWRAALKIDPNAAEPHYRLGRTEMDRAKLSAALEHFRKALAHAPEKAPYLPDLCFQMAQAELLSGAKAAALASFEKYLEIAPPSAAARPEAEDQVAKLGGKKVSGPTRFDNSIFRKGKK